MPSLNLWLESLAGEAASSPAPRALLDSLLQNPAKASYSSISEVSEMAGISLAAITRAAQSWGFRGWPALREALRSRYLESLSLTELHEHRARASGEDPVAASLDADRRSLLAATSTATFDIVREVAAAAAVATTRIALGVGSYRTIAELLATYFSIAGYPTRAPVDLGEVSGALAILEPGDLVIAFDFWRGFAITTDAMAAAHAAGATTCLVTDRAPGELAMRADHIIRVPSESSAFLPTMVPTVAIVNALTAELSAADPERTTASISRLENTWRTLGAVRGPRLDEA